MPKVIRGKAEYIFDCPFTDPPSSLSCFLPGDKPHACELCNKKFALACNLRAHLKTHEGDPQDECVRCGNMYLLSSNELSQSYCAKCLKSDHGDHENSDETGNDRISTSSSINASYLSSAESGPDDH